MNFKKCNIWCNNQQIIYVINERMCVVLQNMKILCVIF